ncbi:Serine--tRNA ligase cytoplasmic [Bienertia sinuspersici]
MRKIGYRNCNFCYLKGTQGLLRYRYFEEHENEVKSLKHANWKLEDDVVEMANENTEQLAIISSATADKKLYNLLVASWVLFAIVFLLLGRGG